MEEKLYADRDAEALGELYFKHVNAMTAEGLHEKSKIAAELAHRDREIERLQKLVGELMKTADGVPVVDGMPLWTLCGRQVQAITYAVAFECVDRDTDTWEPSEFIGVPSCYSTREAALAARAQEK